MKITDNTYLFSGKVFGALGEVYGIRTCAGMILIDSGAPDIGRTNVMIGLQTWGIEGVPVSHVILTHGHWDHAGSAKAFQDEGAKIMVIVVTSVDINLPHQPYTTGSKIVINAMLYIVVFLRYLSRLNIVNPVYDYHQDNSRRGRRLHLSQRRVRRHGYAI
ncbi:hypothetical protein AGMMS49992_19590 [Clostridia bacterium]|nr:hypothetical protein AGMMS49992_19590 [Clostridia bacterium]